MAILTFSQSFPFPCLSYLPTRLPIAFPSRRCKNKDPLTRSSHYGRIPLRWPVRTGDKKVSIAGISGAVDPRGPVSLVPRASTRVTNETLSYVCSNYSRHIPRARSPAALNARFEILDPSRFLLVLVSPCDRRPLVSAEISGNARGETCSDAPLSRESCEQARSVARPPILTHQRSCFAINSEIVSHALKRK